MLLPLELLSGARTPRESIPFVLRELMLLVPTIHFVELSQAVLFRGALARFGKAMRQDREPALQRAPKAWMSRWSCL